MRRYLLALAVSVGLVTVATLVEPVLASGAWS